MTNSPQDDLRNKLLNLRRPDVMSYGDTLEVSTDDVIKLIMSYATKRERLVLESIGEPTLRHVGQMRPDHYEGGFIIDKWYKDRIAQLLSSKERDE